VWQRSRLIDANETGPYMAALIPSGWVDPRLAEPLGGLRDLLRQAYVLLPAVGRAHLDALFQEVWPFLQQLSGTVDDFLYGVLAEFVSVNTWFNPPGLRELIAPRSDESPAVTLGRLVGDTLVLAQAGGEIVGGDTIIGGGLAACLGTIEFGGEGCVAVAPAFAAGGAIIAHGTVTAGVAVAAWNQNYGVLQVRLRDAPTGRFVTDPENPPSPYQFTDAQRRAEWKKLAQDPNSALTEAQRKEIEARGWRGPIRVNPETGELETMELSHEPVPLREGGTQVVPRWPADHAAVDPYRRLKKPETPP
jgi:hypothetical protein